MLRVHILSSLVFCFPLVIAQCLAPLSSADEFLAKTYDYLVIGGGTAGLTVATRLAEDTSFNVGVIEAGYLHIPDSNISVPFFENNAVFHPEYDWMLSTVPQISTGNRSIETPRGKLLGGSSAINGMAWTRASIPEYATWDSLNDYSGGWDWNSLLPYFLKSQMREANPEPGLSGFSTSYDQNGFYGPIATSLNAEYSGIIPPYIDALEQLGVSINHNPLDGNTSGIWNALVAVDRNSGSRSDSATGYYCPSAKRPNLHVLSGATVTRVLFDNSTSNLTATGVAFVSGGSQYVVNATREIVLSTGVLKTPQLLELSGVGNATLLKNLGINPLIDLPGVGENLQEHIFITSQYELSDTFRGITFDDFGNATFASIQEAIYNKTRQGWLAATNCAFLFLPLDGFLNETEASSLLDTFDQSVQLLESTGSASPLVKAQLGIQRSWLTNGTVPQMEIIQIAGGLVETVPGNHYMSLLSGVMHPVSRGSVHINTTNALAPPVIVSNFLTADFDVQLLLDLFTFNNKIVATEPLSSYITAQILPPPNLTDADLVAYIRETFVIGDHIMGTATMASRSLGGVVDPHLKVYGTSNLRVVDVSVFPSQIASHLQATVYAIAEKAADLVKAAVQ
ncbi:GMC oxidoreductase [Pisolithus tinctorius]|nr:GMC oxidoreductase [Pisolithus tinctorius]